MPRGKSMTKSGWKQRDRKYQDEQRAKARANRERRESAAETAAILADPDTMAALAEAEADLQAGRVSGTCEHTGDHHAPECVWDAPTEGEVA